MLKEVDKTSSPRAGRRKLDGSDNFSPLRLNTHQKRPALLCRAFFLKVIHEQKKFGGNMVTAEEMIKEMERHRWGYDLEELDSDEAIKEEYDRMVDELSDDYLMFPNGRDYDAEDEDGI